MEIVGWASLVISVVLGIIAFVKGIKKCKCSSKQGFELDRNTETENQQEFALKLANLIKNGNGNGEDGQKNNSNMDENNVNNFNPHVNIEINPCINIEELAKKFNLTIKPDSKLCVEIINSPRSNNVPNNTLNDRFNNTFANKVNNRLYSEAVKNHHFENHHFENHHFENNDISESDINKTQNTFQENEKHFNENVPIETELKITPFIINKKR